MTMPSSETPTQETRPRLRLEQIVIQNYKALDELTLSFPLPSTVDQLDAIVLGSKNGIGKTSVLECCALALLSTIYSSNRLNRMRSEEDHFRANSAFETLIRSGASSAAIAAKLVFDSREYNVEVEFSSDKIISNELPALKEVFFERRYRDSFEDLDEWPISLFGMNSEPLILPPVLYFHSYRKVQEGSSELGAMVDPSLARRRYTPRRYGESVPLSTFKIVLIQALMAKSGLFESIEEQSESNQEIIDRLNNLMKEFAGGIVDKLRPGRDGTLELRVAPTKGGASFSFDGLSSGQKEIIATLFLIWYTTRNQPSLVLIDEPELHLNAEWQRVFVRTLADLAPKNQYILATHSEEIFRSVTKERRILLQRS